MYQKRSFLPKKWGPLTQNRRDPQKAPVQPIQDIPWVKIWASNVGVAANNNNNNTQKLWSYVPDWSWHNVLMSYVEFYMQRTTMRIAAVLLPNMFAFRYSIKLH